jgi:hypothetical protein
LGDCLLWANFLTFTEVAHIFGYFFQEKRYVLILAKTWFGYILDGDIFPNSSGRPASFLLPDSLLLECATLNAWLEEKGLLASQVCSLLTSKG